MWNYGCTLQGQSPRSTPRWPGHLSALPNRNQSGGSLVEDRKCLQLDHYLMLPVFGVRADVVSIHSGGVAQQADQGLRQGRHARSASKLQINRAI
jgi:hypothetical protein